MRLGLALALAAILAAASAAGQEREVEVGPAGAPVYESADAASATVKDLPGGTRLRPISRQWGFYKIRFGARGRVGWIRASDTVAPAGAKPAPVPAKAAPPTGAKAAAPARPARGVPARAAAPAPTPAPAAEPAAAADGGADETAAAAPAARPEAPLAPPLRLAWPPPLGEWLKVTRAWADTVSPAHLGVAGALVLLVLLVLAYLGYRVVKGVVLLPVRAVRRVARRLARRAEQRQAAPPKVRAEVAARLAEIEGLTAAVAAAGPTGVSLHETYVAAGADDCAITAFAAAAAQREAQPEFPGWLALLTEDDPVARDDFTRAWLLEVVRARAQSFLDLHPAFGGRGLRAEREEGDEATDIAFQFVSASGLGATLDGEQHKAALLLTTAIERARVHLPNPYAVADFIRALAAAAAPDPAAAPAAVESSPVPPLATLLFGAAPHQNAGAFTEGGAVAPEVTDAVDRHRESGREVCDGPALLAAITGVAPGVGAVLVAALSGGMSAAAATLKLRQTLTQNPGSAVSQASATLGARVAGWVAGRERKMLVAAVERALGREALDAALARARGLRQMHGRDLAQDAQRLLGKWQKVRLPEALLEVHTTDLERVRAAVSTAADRYVGILATLAERPDDRAALAAVGYLVAGLGVSAFADAPDATRVLIAEAARPVRRTATRAATSA